MANSLTLDYYVKAFSKLRVDRTHGIPAPHKPILLLSILQSVLNKIINSRNVYLTPELVSLFKHNWSVLVKSNHDCRISYPFYHLKTSGFWKLIPHSEFDQIDAIGSAVKSFSKLNNAIECAVLSQDLFELMLDSESNLVLQRRILDSYFSGLRFDFKEIQKLYLLELSHLEDKILHESATEYKREILNLIEEKNEEELFLRGSLFKREIPKIYNNTCCISGMRIDSTHNISMIDACHIIPFSVSYDDTISNGIALSPNLHRAFDRGLITINEYFKVEVSTSFVESSSLYSIKNLAEKSINLPERIDYYPLIANLQWHRENIFKC